MSGRPARSGAPRIAANEVMRSVEVVGFRGAMSHREKRAACNKLFKIGQNCCRENCLSPILLVKAPSMHQQHAKLW